MAKKQQIRLTKKRKYANKSGRRCISSITMNPESFESVMDGRSKRINLADSLNQKNEYP